MEFALLLLPFGLAFSQYKRVGLKLYIPLVLLMGFLVVFGVNMYHAGVYADAHGLDGRWVGWFAPYGVLTYGISYLLTAGYAITLYVTAKKRSTTPHS